MKIIKYVFYFFIILLIIASVRGIVQRQTLHTNAINNIKLSYSGNKEFLGLVLIMDFIVINNNPIPIKDMEITCKLRGNSGTVLESNKRIIYDAIAGNSRKEIKAFPMGAILKKQVSQVTCEVTDAKIIGHS